MTPPTVAPYSEEEINDFRPGGPNQQDFIAYPTARWLATYDTLRAENKGLREQLAEKGRLISAMEDTQQGQLDRLRESRDLTAADAQRMYGEWQRVEGELESLRKELGE